MAQKDTAERELQKEFRAWVQFAQKAVADLLLNRGLYQRVELMPPLLVELDQWTTALPERLHRDCDVCTDAGQTTWSKDTSTTSSTGLHTYGCMSCRRSRIVFMLALVIIKKEETPARISGHLPDVHLVSYAIEKTGQYPAWEAPLSRTLSKALGKEGRTLFIKGASSLRAGRGIGAVAYFRRIIENHVDDILRMVAESAAVAGDSAAIEQIKEAGKNLYASDRLRIAAQHTPPHLKPGGHSPLDVMYGAFSEGLHALSDEESAEVATKLLESITYFFEMWQENKDRAERFAQTITKTATKSS